MTRGSGPSRSGVSVGVGDGVERHHRLVARAFLHDAEIEPPRMARALGGLGGVEILQRDVQHARQLRHRLEHLLRRGRIGIVDVQHGDVRNVEALRLVVELGVQQLLAQQAVDGRIQEVVHFLRQRVDEPEGALVLAEFLRRQRAVVDGLRLPALSGCSITKPAHAIAAIRTQNMVIEAPFCFAGQRPGRPHRTALAPWRNGMVIGRLPSAARG